MRPLLAFIMLLHGLAHGVGFSGAWRLGSDIPYKTTILAGRIDVGDTGIRVVGLLWLLAAVAFVLSAIGALANHPFWLRFAAATAAASLVLCTIELPQSRIGVGLNALILITLLVLW